MATHSVGKMLHRERKHEASVKTLDQHDHLTKRGGGTPTHGEEANFKTPEAGAKDRQQFLQNEMPAVARAATGAGAERIPRDKRGSDSV